MRLRARSALRVLAVAAVALALGEAPALLFLRAPLRDGLVRAAAAIAPPQRARDLPDAVILAIDTRSYQELAGWPWSRQLWARVIDALDAAGARAIVLDIEFSSEREGTAALAAAMARSGRVVLAALGPDRWDDAGERRPSWPRPELAAAAAAIGVASAPLDRDGAVRRVEPVTAIGDRPTPSLARAALTVASGVPAELGEADAVPLDVRRIRPPIARISLARLLDGSADRARFRDRVVFVGATAPVLQDLWYTPLGAGTPGVVLHTLEYRQHAAALEGQRPLREHGLAGSAALALLASAIGGVFGLRGPHRRMLGLGGATLASGLGALALVTWASLLVELLVPWLALAAHYLLGVEQLRNRLGRMLLERERSMRAVLGVGQITAGSLGPEQARAALRMLALAADAEAIQLQLLDPGGELDADTALVWSRVPTPVEPRRRTLLGALSRREMSVRVRGEHALAYVPLLGAGHAVGVIVAQYPAGAPPDEEALTALHALGSQVGLALVNERLLGHLRDVMEQAQAASRAKTAFLGSMSHEIRTPMTALLGSVDLLEDPTLLDARRAELLDQIRGHAHRTLDVLGDVLEFAQLQAGGVQPDCARMDPRALVSDLVGELAPALSARGLELEVDVSSAVPPAIHTDAARVRRVALIALRNAIAFSEEGPVRLEVDATGDALVLRVRDRGPGLDPSLLERVFEPFLQADDSTTRTHGGTGLGLALARRHAEVLGGSVELTSAPGQGACFELKVPLEPVAADVIVDRAELDGAPAVAPTDTGTRADSGDLRVLIAEDSPDSARIFAHLLSRAGFRVDVAPDGLRACEQARAAIDADDPHAVILMDMDMPELDGYAATARLRRAGVEIPIVALTAHSLPDERQRCLAAGCSDYASKPIGRDALIELVRRHAAAHKSQS